MKMSTVDSLLPQQLGGDGTERPFKVTPIPCHDLSDSLYHLDWPHNEGEVTTLLVHLFNLLLQRLELRLIYASRSFNHGPFHTLSQETLNHFDLSLNLTF